jgi:hypothetical protein
MKYYVAWYVGNREQTESKIAAKSRKEAMEIFAKNNHNPASVVYVQCRLANQSDRSPNF